MTQGLSKFVNYRGKIETEKMYFKYIKIYICFFPIVPTVKWCIKIKKQLTGYSGSRS